MKRVACAHENCGTFPMDDALYAKLQRTGETFTCPDGHPQSFTDSTYAKLKRARKLIEKLKQQVNHNRGRAEQYRDTIMDYVDDLHEERDRRKHLERMVLAERNGVIEVGPSEFKWSCPCGSRGRKSFESPDQAKRALAGHHDRTKCTGSHGLGRVLL